MKFSCYFGLAIFLVQAPFAVAKEEVWHATFYEDEHACDKAHHELTGTYYHYTVNATIAPRDERGDYECYDVGHPISGNSGDCKKYTNGGRSEPVDCDANDDFYANARTVKVGQGVDCYIYSVLHCWVQGKVQPQVISNGDWVCQEVDFRAGVGYGPGVGSIKCHIPE
ncbi:hypothetical protein F4819DRAFT_487025 [Hypoxylon fuscum]|nr:hypothetical protein F4819DRAFT_487025 [Hypoxylon fuscum]